MKFNIRSGTFIALGLHTVVAAAAFILILSIYLYGFLPKITDHGVTVSVPNLNGVAVSELDQLLAQHNLRYEVSDSSYSEKFPPRAVVHQYPPAHAHVKKNRLIYITINPSKPPTIFLPHLIDQSQINAEALLRSNGLKLGEVILTPGPFSSLIKEARYQGKPIQAGVALPRGAAIDLIVTDGQESSVFALENLVGSPYKEAAAKLREWNLHVGHVYTNGVDTVRGLSVVVRQDPEGGQTVSVGDAVNLWLSDPS